MLIVKYACALWQGADLVELDGCSGFNGDVTLFARDSVVGVVEHRAFEYAARAHQPHLSYCIYAK